MLLHGPVRVAADAMPGNAKMVVAMAKGSAFRSIPTELQVVIE
jgi:hypothetical protein